MFEPRLAGWMVGVPVTRPSAAGACGSTTSVGALPAAETLVGSGSVPSSAVATPPWASDCGAGAAGGAGTPWSSSAGASSPSSPAGTSSTMGATVSSGRASVTGAIASTTGAATSTTSSTTSQAASTIGSALDSAAQAGTISWGASSSWAATGATGSSIAAPARLANAMPRVGRRRFEVGWATGGSPAVRCGSTRNPTTPAASCDGSSLVFSPCGTGSPAVGRTVGGIG